MSEQEKAVVVQVLPSHYFPIVADVIVTSCGHRHLRPAGMVGVGQPMACPFCEDAEPPPDA
jgi:hypothetical protein